MEIIEVATRLTYKYTSGWKYLDKWGTPFRVKLLKWRTVNDTSEGRTEITRAIAPIGTDDHIVANGIVNSLSSSRCHHEYDCCGCIFSSVTVKKLKNRTWLVTRRSQINC